MQQLSRDAVKRGGRETTKTKPLLLLSCVGFDACRAYLDELNQFRKLEGNFFFPGSAFCWLSEIKWCFSLLVSQGCQRGGSEELLDMCSCLTQGQLMAKLRCELKFGDGQPAYGEIKLLLHLNCQQTRFFVFQLQGICEAHIKVQTYVLSHSHSAIYNPMQDCSREGQQTTSELSKKWTNRSVLVSALLIFFSSGAPLTTSAQKIFCFVHFTVLHNQIW